MLYTPVAAILLSNSFGDNTRLDFHWIPAQCNIKQAIAEQNYLGFHHVRDAADDPADPTTYWPPFARATGAKFDAFIQEGSPAKMARDISYWPALFKTGLVEAVEGEDEEADHEAVLGDHREAGAAGGRRGEGEGGIAGVAGRDV